MNALKNVEKIEMKDFKVHLDEHFMHTHDM
jgi:hypothetical protein